MLIRENLLGQIFLKTPERVFLKLTVFIMIFEFDATNMDVIGKIINSVVLRSHAWKINLPGLSVIITHKS